LPTTCSILLTAIFCFPIPSQNFCTNDPSIFAVGNFTRFSRAFRDEPMHSKHSSREMGLFVGEQLLRKHLDPTSREAVFGAAMPGAGATGAFMSMRSVSDALLLPKFKFPKTVSIALPNGRTFFHSALSASASASDTALLTTGDLGTDNTCILKLDGLGTLLELAAVCKGEIEAKNLGRLPGWHESFLNGAVASYEQGFVQDWVEYFRGDWATVLYHDTFPEFADILRSSLQTDKYAYSIVDIMLDTASKSSDDQDIIAARKQELGPRAEKMNATTYKMIETATLDFLRKNKAMLPRFFIPQPKPAASVAAAKK